jgi:hypothetical protein
VQLSGNAAPPPDTLRPDSPRPGKEQKAPEEEAADKLPLIGKALPEEGKDLLRFLMSGPEDIRSPVLREHPSDINMGDKETLREFLIDNVKRFPARRYAVILSGHGAAFGGSMIVHNPEGRIRNEELAEVLKDVTGKTGASIDILDMNTCFSANLESLYPLKGAVKNVVASESTVFAATQPFSTILKDLQQGLREGADLTGKDLSTLIVEESRRRPLGNVYTETLSSIDMEKIGAVADAVGSLQETLMKESVAPEVIREAYMDSARIDYSSVPRQAYVTDVGSFADAISRRVKAPSVRKAALALKSALQGVRVRGAARFSRGGVGDEQNSSFVLRSREELRRAYGAHSLL